jgi:hypothetical protein
MVAATFQSDDISAVAEAARNYLGRGWQPLPVPFRSKNPGRDDWQRERRTADNLDADFGARLVNVGIMTGEPSGGLIDVDLDTSEAVALAPVFLPGTGAIFGRPGRPASHWLYVADDPGSTHQFKAVGGTMLVEYRSTGGQTIAPPSVTSERVRWDRDEQPTRIERPILLRQVQHLAAATLLARCWPEQGSRHDASMALSGGLLRAGWTEDDAAEFVVAVATAAGDEEARSRAADVRTTARRLAEGGAATGWSTLRQLVGDKAVRKVRAWLGATADVASDAPTADRAGDGSPGMNYGEKDGRLYWFKQTRDGATPVLLANFTARIVADVVTDDGADVRRAWEIEARQGERTARGTVPVERFAGMGWAVDLLGARAVVSAGNSTRDHARAAIQHLSSGTVERRVYAHIGWRKIDGVWVYLHAAGAIGEDGAVTGIDVDPPSALSRFVLPPPPDGDALRKGIRASLAMLDAAPDGITAPVLGAAHRAPLGEVDGAVHLVGMTGAGKSELAALAQQHYGAGLDRRHLPASWVSTGNSLEALAFAAKDALLVVDDFAPSGSAQAVQRYHAEAERLFRAQGNNAGRQRLRADATLRAAKHPRGMILSTGEDVPRGQSARARALNVDVPRDAVRFDRLSEFQQAAADGLPALATAGYIRWLAARRDDLEASVRADVISLRGQADGSPAHRRTPELVANLGCGWRWWLRYAVDVGALTRDKAAAVWGRVWDGLGDAAAQQDAQQRSSEPTRRFLELIAGALAAGAAHVADPAGDAPRDARPWGWRERTIGAGENARGEWLAQGARVGWIDADGLYLEPEASYAAAQRLGTGGGDSIAVTQRMLSRMLFERKLLVRSERERNRYTVRRDLEGRRRNVLHLTPDILEAPPAKPAAQTAQTAHDRAGNRGPIWSTPDDGPISWAVYDDPADETARGNGPRAPADNQSDEDVGPFDDEGGGSRAERFVGWRCSACHALESVRRQDGSRRCDGCGARTDDTGRVQCATCDGPVEDVQRLGCLACIRNDGGAA